MKVRLKKWYVAFIEEDSRSFLGNIFYLFLYLLSLVYRLVVTIRNFLYNKNLLKSYYSGSSFIIGVGNISWAGTGKTPLCLWLYRQFGLKIKSAILRRGYGQDEEKLIKEECDQVFSSPNRMNLVKGLEKRYDLFILDDAFQYRKLKKDLEIVIMGQREFDKKINLIPVSFFREPFKNIKRADFLIINYKNQANREKIKRKIAQAGLEPEVYFAGYRISGLEGLDGKRYDFNQLRNKRIAAFAAIGYPQGFFGLLKENGFKLEREIRYPDHYNLSNCEYSKLEQKLLNSGINSLAITRKDKYHLPQGRKKIDIFMVDVKLEIENKKRFLEAIVKKINKKLN
ncbi:MAG: tetraacyldisaccharide 4'-kinase [Candidatus Omnitrophica bacterium]|nr:tetraacyldisaccharide 4'-kinase [Candidatus Omnitrophota bacterium]MCF7877188.1 tetraacyldisaccharide 4'-kinase [Candidatus Omnitrophota bacterium]MCF7877993.1 tetraacyldisaccharide 4'-kinase [Candidatus Omnitrophota bacterium]MCF7892915.1 tetraacyldisaccharide 4'-kinase [Candidatus Omnitrophota bacterium]